jgi:hypothetical protein
VWRKVVVVDDVVVGCKKPVSSFIVYIVDALRVDLLPFSHCIIMFVHANKVIKLVKAS